MADTSWEDLWRPPVVRRLARELADIAADELTRRSGPVRPPDFVARTRRVLRRGARPGHLAAAVKALAEAGLHLNHPRYMAQQVAAPIPAAALAESAVAALNQSIAVLRMSPAGTLVDREVIARFKPLFGLPASAEGSLVPGGSFANLTALVAARAALDPLAWKNGGARIAIVAGAQTHYSISRAAGIMGLGADAVFSIPQDGAFRTDPARASAAFAAARRAGYRKFILAATCGSTSTGSCDDLRALAAVARRERAWFHVDAAHGGGFAFSRRLRGKLRGIERADSLTFDPHKTLFMPLAAGAVLVRRGRYLRGAFTQHAPYLFRGGARPIAPNVGEFTIACSQRFDALKIWLTWQAYGGAFFGGLIERACDATLAAHDYCLRSPLLEPAHRPECNIFCFRLRRPPRRAAAADRRHAELEDAVNESGQAYISSTVLDGRRVLRIVVLNPRTTAADTVAVMRLVERLAGREGARGLSY